MEATVSAEPMAAGPVAAEPSVAELAPATAPCAHCGAALAHDQRYCLQCGAPRTYLSGLHQLDGLRSAAGSPPGGYSAPTAPGSAYLTGSGATGHAQSPPGYPPAGGTPAGGSRWGGGPALLAGVGVLLLAMGVGVLIGRSGSNTGKAAAVPPAQVITVDQAGVGAGTETGASQPTAPAAKTHASTKKAAAKSKSSATSGKQSGVGESIEKPAPPSVLKTEKSKGGGSYEQKSKNLPNVISTG